MHPDGVGLQSDWAAVRYAPRLLLDLELGLKLWPIRATPRCKSSRVIAAWAKIRSARFLLWPYPVGARSLDLGECSLG